MSLAAVLADLEAGADEHVRLLQDWIRIPSVSADPAHAVDVRSAADWLAERLREAGMEDVHLVETSGHPSVVARRDVDPEAPTVLVYGHYDVQPAAQEDGWWCDPFAAELRDGRVWGRGTTDDKGQVLCHVLAARAWDRAGGPPVNLRMVFEGEEEVGSAHFLEVLEKESDFLAADLLIVSDSPMRGENRPAITHSLRGLVYLQVDVHGPRTDLHSGSYGGAVRNPAEALVHMIASLKDPETGRIRVPGYYDPVVEPSDTERAAQAEVSESSAEIAAAAGVERLWGEAGWSDAERVSVRPTLEVNGIWAGYTGEGSKTVIPASAHAKLSCRLVADQDPQAVADALEAALRAAAPPEVRIEVTHMGQGHPVRSDPAHPLVQAVASALEATWGTAPVFIPEGGSIPAVADMQRLLGVTPVLAGFGHRDENMHGPEESFRIDSLHKGTQAAARILAALSAA